MYGRYGQDELSVFLSFAALILVVIGLFTGSGIFSGLAIFFWRTSKCKAEPTSLLN